MNARIQPRSASDRFLVGLSVLVQLVAGFFFGHAYDMRIFMATGYLVGTGRNPYLAQNLSSVFHNSSFQGITSVGYPPPWPLLTGFIYLVTYKLVPSLLLYNLGLKLPIIAANICMAFLVVKLLTRCGLDRKGIRSAWLFMLFNPFLLYISAAWGQIDSIVALFSLLALVFLSEENLTGSAIFLALAVSFKPSALPLVLAVLVYRRGKSFRRTVGYFGVFLLGVILLCVAPFFLLGWDPTIILRHWNAQFTVGGGLSFMTFLELVADTYQLPGWWWIAGWIWVPALGVAALALKPGGEGFLPLLKKSLALVLVFFLFRAWLSETNLFLILPMVLILAAAGKLDSRALTAAWVIPWIFSFFNTSAFQLLFPSLPALMNQLLQFSEAFRAARLALRIIVVVPWLMIGGWIIRQCFKADQSEKL